MIKWTQSWSLIFDHWSLVSVLQVQFCIDLKNNSISSFSKMVMLIYTRIIWWYFISFDKNINIKCTWNLVVWYKIKLNLHNSQRKSFAKIHCKSNVLMQLVWTTYQLRQNLFKIINWYLVLVILLQDQNKSK